MLSRIMMIEDSPQRALGDALKAVEGPTGLAKLIPKITPQAISQWPQVPSKRVLEVEKATGISRHRLRPDLYPVEQ